MLKTAPAAMGADTSGWLSWHRSPQPPRHSVVAPLLSNSSPVNVEVAASTTGTASGDDAALALLVRVHHRRVYQFGRRV